MPIKPLSAPVDTTDGEADAAFGGRLYGEESYSVWSRRLHAGMPLASGARLLFESSIDEPTDLLATLTAKAFSQGAPDRYVSVFGRGHPYLIDRIAARYGVTSAEVLTTTGVSNGVAQILATLVSAGDEVLVETPGFDVLGHLVQAAGAVVAPLVRRAPDFDLTANDLGAALTSATRVVIISNLHNPSGRLLDEQRLLDLAQVAAAKNVWLVVDEVYADLARSGPLGLSTAPNLIRVNSLSKVHGLYALRCGWVIAEEAVISRIASANASREFGTSKLTHTIAALALEAFAPFEAHMRAILAERRPIIARHLDAMTADGLMAGSMPEFGCMAFPRVCDHPNTLELARRLWRDHGLVTAPGEMFGHAGHMRLGIGASGPLLDEGLSRLHAALRG